MTRRASRFNPWTRFSFSVKFAFIIAVAGVLIAIIPLSLAIRENGVQASQSAADKAGIVSNLISGQERSLTSFAGGMASELSVALARNNLQGLTASLARYSHVNSSTDIVGVSGPLGDLAAQAARQIPPPAGLVAGDVPGTTIVADPAGVPWLIGRADVGSSGEAAYIARPLDATFLTALEGTITSSADHPGIAVVRNNRIAAAGGTILGKPVTSGTALPTGLAGVVTNPRTAQTVTVSGQSAGAAALPLDNGYIVLVTTVVDPLSALVQPVAFLLALIIIAMLSIVLVVQIDVQRPLRRLDRAVAGMASQEYGLPVHVGGHDVIGRLELSFEHMRRELRSTLVGSRARAAIASELNSSQSLRTALLRVCGQLRQSSGGDAAFILVGRGDTTGGFAVVDGIAPGIDAEQLLHDEGPIGSVYRQGSGEAVLVAARAESAEFRIGLRELCVAPLNLQGTVHGVIGLSRRVGDFTSADVSLVVTSAEQVALALERDRVFASVQREASTDDLTGLYNHRFLVDYLGHQVALAERLQTPLAVLVIDLDHFKQVNDTFGHPVGDTVLRVFAQCLVGSVRRADLAARYGGEEFIVVMSNTSAADAVRVAEKIRAAVEALVVTVDGERRVSMTVSVGGAAYPEDTATARELLATADAALYDAKRAGRNRVHMAGGDAGHSEALSHVTTVVRRPAQ